MPQVFGTEDMDLIHRASSFLWVEAADDERTVEKLTHPQVAAEARSRGLVPLRMGRDPIWVHPDTGKIVSLTPAHSGESINYNRTIKNAISGLKRNFPTAEEQAKSSRTPDQIEADRAAAADSTRTKKQQAADAAKRQRERDNAVSQRQQAETDRILFEKEHGPFRNMGEIQKAFDARSQKAKDSRLGDTVEQFASRLKGLEPGQRQQIHRAVFPERYK